ncbi:amino acid/amide ABC transporter substrate-binding protein, HAAT family [Mariniphaga anaerophila]|uniref:Amino acid/amide ABC transporter substrate-binding protein, HAAT family n=1 Tax=Mariniphaga anaerophila TaxID=1484053 RepID=A0A1M5EST1_9BACT|nr:ABC transporter substrate-binding protein [Mariniphaga anaerophila]SHF82315.1 amino acid/amide ABC transporter substrate-binding protein, HAAT family [Mariniphaga anaerophila]
MNSRRNFLKIAGTGLTASVLQPFVSSGAKLNTKGQKIRVGVLLPQSVEHPGLPGSFLNGLRFGVDQRNAIKRGKIELITEMVNFGTPQIVKEKSQKLIAENNVDFMTGVLNSEVASHIGNIFSNAKLPFLVANAGESYLVNETKNNPYLFFNSLNLFQAAYHTGKYAVEHFGKNIAIVTSFYDSGYDSLFTFRQGVEAAGGNASATYLAGQNDKNFVGETIEKLKQSSPDAVYVFLNGSASDDMLRSMYYGGLKIPVLTTAFSTDREHLNNLGEAAQNVISVAGWNDDIDSKTNRVFVENYQKKWNRMPDMFAFLGYETGQIIYDVLSRCKNGFEGQEIADSVKRCSLESPRGKIFVNPESGMVNNKLFVNKVVTTLSGVAKNEIVEVLDPVNEFDEQFASLDNNYRTGWLNPYLFV